jgi:hypothetical protein
MSDYVCNTCTANGKEFRVPADNAGVGIMQGHLQEEHPDVARTGHPGVIARERRAAELQEMAEAFGWDD